MKLWNHQVRGLGQVASCMSSGLKRLALTAPCGGGKSRIMMEMSKWGVPTLVLCNRRMLFEQLCGGFHGAGIDFGQIASGYAPSIRDDNQVAMLQTISSRWEANRIVLPPADLVVLDEAHAEAGPRTKKILDYYIEQGATTVCVSATPVGIGHLADHLIYAGTNSELRSCGALVAATIKAPDEIEAAAYKGTARGVLQLDDDCREVVLKTVMGRILEHYFKFNPFQRPAILFAPGVAEAEWITSQFMKAGVPWSCLTSKRITLNGVELPATPENRALLLEASRTGLTKGISSRFILREAIDAPWWWHCILAAKFTTFAGYIQAVSRVLRAHPSLSDALITDHAGCYWNFGSPNDDHHWELDDTEKALTERRKQQDGTPEQPEPIVCPSCSTARTGGAVCPSCGFAYQGKKRVIVQSNGELKTVEEAARRHHVKLAELPEHAEWKKVFWMARNSGKTFKQAYAIYGSKYGRYPDRTFPMFAKQGVDWSLPVREIGFDKLSEGRSAKALMECV